MFYLCDSDERNLVRARTSMRHSEGSVRYFLKIVTVHGDNQGVIALVIDPQIQPRYQAHRDQVPSLPEFI